VKRRGAGPANIENVTNGTPSRGRMLGARVLVFLGALFLIASLLAGYVRFQALDTDTVRESASLLIEDEEIRDQVAASLVDQLFTNVDVTAQLEQQLPADQQGLAGALSAAVRELADRGAVRMLDRPRAQELWVDTVAFSHEQLITVLEDDARGVETDQGAVFLDLGPLLIELGKRVPILGRLAAQLPEGSERIKIMDANQLETAQDLTKLLKTLGSWLWVVPLVLFAAALALASGRRRAILRSIGIATIVTGLLVLAVRKLAGSYIVDTLVPTASAETAAGNAWDILTRQLADGGWTFIGLGVVLLVAVWISGVGRSATAARTELAPFLARAEVAFGAAAVLFALLLLWAPTVQTTRVPLMIAAAVVLAFGVEVLRRMTAVEHPGASEVDLSDYARERFARLRDR
jgi:hypothetical protein